MTDRPILFSAPMILALLDGRKTQTRRILKVAPRDTDFTVGWFHPTVIDRHGNEQPGRRTFGLSAPDGYWTQNLPFAPSDHLWVREAWRADVCYDDLKPSQMGGEEGVRYEADGAFGAWTFGPRKPGRSRPGMFMPRWASRLTLTVSDVRVQRLNDISEADAIAEGLACLSKDGGRTYKWGIPDRDGLPGRDDNGWHWCDWNVDPRYAYSTLWDHINGARAWEANPWIVATTFNTAQRNIDTEATSA